MDGGYGCATDLYVYCAICQQSPVRYIHTNGALRYVLTCWAVKMHNQSYCVSNYLICEIPHYLPESRQCYGFSMENRNPATLPSSAVDYLNS